jgi:hypothetical protein
MQLLSPRFESEGGCLCTSDDQAGRAGRKGRGEVALSIPARPMRGTNLMNTGDKP